MSGVSRAIARINLPYATQLFTVSALKDRSRQSASRIIPGHDKRNEGNTIQMSAALGCLIIPCCLSAGMTGFSLVIHSDVTEYIPSRQFGSSTLPVYLLDLLGAWRTVITVFRFSKHARERATR